MQKITRLQVAFWTWWLLWKYIAWTHSASNRTSLVGVCLV